MLIRLWLWRPVAVQASRREDFSVVEEGIVHIFLINVRIWLVLRLGLRRFIYRIWIHRISICFLAKQGTRWRGRFEIWITHSTELMAGQILPHGLDILLFCLNAVQQVLIITLRRWLALIASRIIIILIARIIEIHLGPVLVNNVIFRRHLELLGI